MQQLLSLKLISVLNIHLKIEFVHVHVQCIENELIHVVKKKYTSLSGYSFQLIINDVYIFLYLLKHYIIIIIFHVY